MFAIRERQLHDYEGIAAICSLIRTEPSGAAEFREDDDRAYTDEAVWFRRLVAVDSDDRVLGYAFIERMDWMPAGRWALYACSHPEFRGRGIGSALHAEAERIAREHGATWFQAYMRSDDEASYEWVQRRGWEQDLLRTESVLDLTAWDGSRFAADLDRVRAGGLRLELYTLDYPEPILRGMWNVEKRTAPDVPDWEPEITFPPYEAFRKEFLEYTGPRCVAAALDGDTVAGFTSLYLPRTAGKGAGTGYTGVLREYRGRGVALAVKVLTMDYAASLGVPRARTHNDFENPSMLAVNRRMGYQFVPGPRRLVKK